MGLYYLATDVVYEYTRSYDNTIKLHNRIVQVKVHRLDLVKHDWSLGIDLKAEDRTSPLEPLV